jgi:hypothetical protein
VSRNPQLSAFSFQPAESAPSARLLEHFRASKRRLPLHPLEKAVLAVVALHLCFLPWALGTMHPWSQITSLALASVGLVLALMPRTYSGDLAAGIQIGAGSREHGAGVPPNNRQPTTNNSSAFSFQPSAFHLNPLPRLLRFPIFWIGLALLGYIALQASNPSWVWTRNATSWWLVRVNDIEWLPTSIESPFERFNIWRQFIIYASAWLTVCTVWTGFTRRRSLQLLLIIVLSNSMLLAAVGFVQRFTGSNRFLFLMEWPVGNTAFGSFIYRNHAGAYFALTVSIAVFLAIWIFIRGERDGRKSTPAGLLVFCAIFLSAAVLFSLSRGAALLLAFFWTSIGIWFGLNSRKVLVSGTTHPGIYAATILIFAAVIGSVAGEIDFSSIQGRFDALLNHRNDARIDSTPLRITAHKAADEMLCDTWVRGIGSGGFRYLFPEYIKKYPEIYSGGQLFWEHAHSDWREIPIELGVAGGALLLLATGWWLRFFYNNRALGHSLVTPALIGCAQTLAHAWFDFPFQNPAVLCTWLALIAVSARWLELDAT